MGYTHYWTQTRALTADEWAETTPDIRDILSYVENELGVPLAGPLGKHRSRPKFSTTQIMFNGLGDDSHETFNFSHKRVKQWEGGRLGADFCKTARKPYDVAVTACLCYLATVTETHTVSSDGHGSDFLDGLAAARAAIPRKANILDIPRQVMESDRWTGPWISGGGASSGYEVYFCIDGYGYVQKAKTGEWYRFDSHEAMGRFLERHKTVRFAKGGHCGSFGAAGAYGALEPNIWDAMGSFDKARHTRTARAQAKALSGLFPADPAHAHNPPAFVRPGEMPRPEEIGEFCYSLSDLIAKADKIAA